MAAPSTTPPSPHLTFFGRIFGWIGVTSELADAARLLQRRVALYMKVLFIIVGAFMSIFMIVAALKSPEELTRPGNLIGTAAVLVIALAWWYASQGERPALRIHALEGSGTVYLSAIFAATTIDIPIESSPDLVASLSAICVLSLRAAIVPSTALRTCAIGFLSVAPGLVLSTWRYPTIPESAAVDWQGVYAIRPYLWAGSTIAITTVTSHVIYGLHTAVREAMQLGQYSLEGKLGAGGMGVVYRATHVMLRRPTAIKLLPPEKAGEETIARFEREVVQTSRLSHPNTVSIYDYGRTPDGVFYYAMEYLDGFTLEDLIDLEGKQPPERVIHLLEQAASSLVEAHDAGLVHRDIKPANIMTTRNGGIADLVKVLDFGLVKHIADSDDAGLTRDDSITGTPHYLPPEAMTRPDVIDGRADLYALGAVGYTLLTGRTVFEGGTMVEVLSKHLHEKPTPPSELCDVPADLERIILSCLSKEPADRPRSAGAVCDALEACEGSGQWKGDRARRWWTESASVLRKTQEARRAKERADQEGRTGQTVNIDVGRRADGFA